MKTYLIKGRNISFRIRKCGSQPEIRQAVIELQMNSHSITPFDPADEDADVWAESLFTKLKSVFSNAEKDRIVDRFASISFQNARETDFEGFKFRVRLQGLILQEIENVLGKDVRVTLEFENLYHEESLYPSVSSPPYLCNGTSQLPLQTEEYKILPLSNWGPGSRHGSASDKISTKEMNITISPVTAFCEDLIDFPECWEQSWCNYIDWMYWEYRTDVNVIISLEAKEGVEGQHGNDTNETTTSEMLAVNRRILQNQWLTDVEIIAANGVTLRCHGIFLAAQSEILMSFFQNQITRISMENISEEGVRAFLAYLYCRDKGEAMRNISIAVELLRASFRYGIASMELSMMNILMNKSDAAFEMDITLNLFNFVAKLQKFKALKLKAVQILKTKFQKMSMSDFFMEFQDNRECAKELVEAFFDSGVM